MFPAKFKCFFRNDEEKELKNEKLNFARCPNDSIEERFEQTIE